MKKASLTLSVNAIVILILAITMLGLGLGFIRGMFTKTSSQFEEVISQEQDPPAPNPKEPLTLSRGSIKTHPKDMEVIKLGAYNPTELPWNGINYHVTCPDVSLMRGVGGEGADRNTACTSTGCIYVSGGGDGSTDTCTGIANNCPTVVLNAADDDARRDMCQSAGCCFEYPPSRSCKLCYTVGVAPSIICKDPNMNDPDSGVNGTEYQTNRKVIEEGESAIFNIVFQTPNVDKGTYLCTVDLMGYQKDMTIRVQ